MKVLELPVGGIVIALGAADPDRPGCYLGGRIASQLKVAAGDPDAKEAEAWNAAVDFLEALVLAHACAGVDVTSLVYREGIQTALDALSNNLSSTISSSAAGKEESTQKVYAVLRNESGRRCFLGIHASRQTAEQFVHNDIKALAGSYAEDDYDILESVVQTSTEDESVLRGTP